MKKTLALVVVVLCVFSLSGAVFATPVTFDSILGTETFGPAGAEIGVSYTHNIITDIDGPNGAFNPSTDTLSSANLNLNLTSSNNSNRPIGITLDGTLSGSYTFNDLAWDAISVNIAWLQTDGILNVTLTRGSGQGSVKITQSELTATGDRNDPVPTPEPTTMLLLGLGLIGLAGARRKIKK